MKKWAKRCWRKLATSGLLLLCIIVFMSGCGTPPDQNESAVTIYETYSSEFSENFMDVPEKLALSDEGNEDPSFPETLQTEITIGEDVQVIDAVVACEAEGDIMEGNLEYRLFYQDEMEEAFYQMGYLDGTDGGDISLTTDKYSFSYYDLTYEKDSGFDEAEELSPETDSIEQNEEWRAEQIEAIGLFLKTLDLHQVVTESETGEINGKNAVSFQTAAAYGGLTIQWRRNDDLSFSGAGLWMDGKMVNYELAKEFLITEERIAELLTFDQLIEKFTELLETGEIACVASGQPVYTIEMCYMVESSGDGYTFFPVWNFDVSYTAEWLKGIDIPEATRYVTLDARDGRLVDYNGGI